MKLAVFSELVSGNPFNAMDKKAGEEFVKNRNESIKNWRRLIYNDLKKLYGDEIDEIDMETGTIKGKEQAKDKKDNKEKVIA